MTRHSTVRWAAVAAYVVVIYATIPVAPDFWRALSRLTRLELVPLARGLLLLGGLVTVTPVVLRPRGVTLTAAGALALAYATVYQFPFEAAAERLHLLEYGVLPALVAWAIGPGQPLPRRLGVGALVGTGVGVGDEWIQSLTPGRVGQWSDVALNAVSAALGAAAAAVIAASRRRMGCVGAERPAVNGDWFTAGTKKRRPRDRTPA